jgi:hypothetical protein
VPWIACGPLLLGGHQQVEAIDVEAEHTAATCRIDDDPRIARSQPHQGRSSPAQERRSITVALAWPPPSHMVWKP